MIMYTNVLYLPMPQPSMVFNHLVSFVTGQFAAFIYLFQERLSEKVHTTIPKGFVGGFEFTVLKRNLKEWHKRPWTYVYECQRKATKVGLL